MFFGTHFHSRYFILGFWSETDEDNSKQKKDNTIDARKTASADEMLLEECIIQPIKTVPDLPVLEISKVEVKTSMGMTEWAEMLDVTKPVDDFEEKIPNMAHTFPFELDTFQKQVKLSYSQIRPYFTYADLDWDLTVS